jgi:hypothetical protein
MFEQMVADLKEGTFPEKNLLRKRFEAALIKKIGVIKTPYSFWPADTKINPLAKQLLWAAILLLDQENLKTVEAIITTELEEKERAKGRTDSIQTLTKNVQQMIKIYIKEFVDLAPNGTFKENLKQRTEKLYPAQ